MLKYESEGFILPEAILRKNWESCDLYSLKAALDFPKSFEFIAQAVMNIDECNNSKLTALIIAVAGGHT